MKVWTITSELTGEISPWHGLWATKDGAIRAVMTHMQEVMGDDFQMTGELEQVNGENNTGEEWLMSINEETFFFTEHTDTEA